uniref:Fatty acid hydroxylase domain-containing protein n=1 Tax=Lotharella globosa TaxID=91324 RepID=A0A6U2Y2S4_9EUKA|mmetsp:Transcript_5884/g.10666  ORF Transcript_5884/g.10666 Transcript_5884/m.10666 type:complete len:274 (+) Transcript_5884:56-877(+)
MALATPELPPAFLLPYKDSLFYEAVREGFRLGIVTLIATILLDLIAWRTIYTMLIRKKSDNSDDRMLYFKAILANLLNNLLLGPLIYGAVVRFHIYKDLENAESLPEDSDDAVTIFGKGCIVLITEAVGYYLMHSAMHTRELIWMHKFHHKFTCEKIVPMAANAVSVAEYLLAYMLPIVLGAVISGSGRYALLWSVGVISSNNLLIHTPWLHDMSEKVLPDIFVSTAKHFDHHNRLTKHYAAPTVDIDLFVSVVQHRVNKLMTFFGFEHTKTI